MRWRIRRLQTWFGIPYTELFNLPRCRARVRRERFANRRSGRSGKEHACPSRRRRAQAISSTNCNLSAVMIPIGAFLIEHFFENSYALVSEQKYNFISGKLQTIPWRVPIELLFHLAADSFHGCYGCTSGGKGSPMRCAHPWMANWLYTLQRWSGIVAFLFIGWHFIPSGFSHRANPPMRAWRNPCTIPVRGVLRDWHGGLGFPSRQRHMEFLLQVGHHRHAACAARRRLGGRGGGLAWRSRRGHRGGVRIPLASFRVLYPMRHPRIIMVGGGLAGPDGRHSRG